MITKTRARNSDLSDFFAVDQLPKPSIQMKQKLRQMAKNKEARPIQKSKEGRALSHYICKSSDAYCEKFNKLIRVEAPLWFVSRSYHMKKKLIGMAKNKEARPIQRSKEGVALNDYICKSSSSYCKKFDKLIRVKAPLWFVSKSYHVKQKLIAKNKEARPHWKTKEGRALCRYTTKSSKYYCEEFNKLIRVEAPDWFRKKLA